MAKKRGTRPKAKRPIVRAGDRLSVGYEAFLGQIKERTRTAPPDSAPHSPPTANGSNKR